VSITDACVNIEDTKVMLEQLAAAVRARRAGQTKPSN
jgi:phospho-2-dehydro-3-deoxyheptonate aldolase